MVQGKFNNIERPHTKCFHCPQEDKHKRHPQVRHKSSHCEFCAVFPRKKRAERSGILGFWVDIESTSWLFLAYFVQSTPVPTLFLPFSIMFDQDMTPEERKKAMKALKKQAPALALYAHPPPKPVYAFGKRIIFSGPIFLYFGMAFISGILDAIFINEYGIYATMSTGNIIKGVLAICTGDFTTAVFAFSMTVSTTIIGGYFSCYVMERLPNKAHSFILLSCCEALACIMTGLVTSSYGHYHPGTVKKFVACLISISNGAICVWVLKMGYTFPLHTVNLLKVSESMYKLVYNISQGGAKLRGDLTTLLSMLLVFMLGCVAGYGADSQFGTFSFFFPPIIHAVMIVYLLLSMKFPNFCASCRLSPQQQRPVSVKVPTPHTSVTRERTPTLVPTPKVSDVERGDTGDFGPDLSTLSIFTDLMPSEIDAYLSQRNSQQVPAVYPVDVEMAIRGSGEQTNGSAAVTSDATVVNPMKPPVRLLSTINEGAEE